VGFAEPHKVGIKQEEQHQRDRKQVHVEAKHHAAVVKTPAVLHATDGIRGASQTAKGGQQEPERRAEMGETGDERRKGEAPEDDEVAAEQRADARIEERMGQEADARLMR
jgi:hypothetical protein